MYGNPIWILSDDDPKFESAAIRNYAATVSIYWKIISACNPRGNVKVERRVGTLKRAIQIVMVSNQDREWDGSFGEILGGYRKRSDTDRK